MGINPVKINCPDCGTEFTSKNRKQIRCPECQTEYRKEMDRIKSRQIYVPRNAFWGGNDPNECKKIKTCIYGGRAGSLDICDYLETVGEKRPCPVQGCTVYKRKPTRRKAEVVTVID